MLSQLLSFALTESALIAMPPVLAQADNPCQNTDAVLPTETMRRLELEQFGVAVMIPENYRAMLLNSGAVQVLDPGTYNLIRCEAIGGDPLGRGYSSLLIRGESAEANQSLEAAVRADVYAERPETATGPPSQCISPYPLGERQGYLVQPPTQRHAEFWIEPEVGADITVLETSCDCAGMVERLTEVLDRTTLLSESSQSQ